MWLAHHGVKGMKWGIRRYQNKDGSLTNLGKRIQQAKRVKSEDHSVSNKNFKGKEIGEISYEELNDKWRLELGKEWLQRFNKKIDMEWLKSKEGMVALENGKKIAGYILIGDYNKKKWITPVETFEEYRGNKIASKLIDKQLDKYDELNLGVYADNPVAKKIYDSKGFETYDHKFYKDGSGVYFMRKRSNKNGRRINDNS